MFDWFKNRGAEKNSLKGLYFNQTDIKQEDFIKIVPVGYFPNHPDGAHQIEARHIEEMVKNFTATKTDLLFDWEHRSLWGDSRAAGWANAMEARADGLYVKYPEFTKPAQEQIANREYRYFSPVYRLNTKNKLGQEIGATIVSVALTNVPYMDSEIDAIKNDKTENAAMDKIYLNFLGLPENATETEVKTKLDAMRTKYSLPATATLDEILAKAATPAAPVEKPASDEPKANSATPDVEKRLAALEADKQRSALQGAEVLVDGAIADGKILPAHRAIWVNSARNDFDGTKAQIAAMAKNAALPATVDKPKAGESQVKVNAVAEATAFIKGFDRKPQPRA